MSDNDTFRKKWMTDAQWECYQMLADLFLGFHRIDGKVRKHNEGIVLNTRQDVFATFDYGYLTRAVIMAHDRMIRFHIAPGGPKMLKLILSKRDGREGEMHEIHPTIEDAIISAREGL